MTSNAILGLNSLSYPFKWCFALIPILPRQMVDFLEAPLPLLVGITKQMYSELKLTEEERNNKIWIFLDEETTQVRFMPNE